MVSSKAKIKKDKSAIQYKKGAMLLFKNSLRIIPINILIALFLSIFLFYSGVPIIVITIWIAIITLIILLRIFHCKYTLNKKLFNIKKANSVKIFNFLALLTGITWVSIYFISLTYLDELNEYIVMIIFGGVSAGAIASLSVSPLSYYFYILPMFVPVIIYNYSFFDVNHSYISTMFLFLMLTMMFQSRETERLLRNTFSLSEENKFLVEQLKELAITDPLTGIYNRRYYDTILPQEYNRSKRNKHTFALMSIDIDNFKLANDKLGHPYGDQLLIFLANLLKDNTRRANDFCFRVGGDEFIVILSNTSMEYSKILCDKIKTQFKDKKSIPIAQDESQKLFDKTSLSIGVVYVTPESNLELEKIITKVDQKLYQAKNLGKDKITFLTLT